MNALQFLLLGLAGWLNRHQQLVIEYLQEEVKVLREQLGRERLRRFAAIVSPRTLLECTVV